MLIFAYILSYSYEEQIKKVPHPSEFQLLSTLKTLKNLITAALLIFLLHDLENHFLFRILGKNQGTRMTRANAIGLLELIRLFSTAAFIFGLAIGSSRISSMAVHRTVDEVLLSAFRILYDGRFPVNKVTLWA